VAVSRSNRTRVELIALPVLQMVVIPLCLLRRGGAQQGGPKHPCLLVALCRNVRAFSPDVYPSLPVSIHIVRLAVKKMTTACN
jgi:hypothetical protein